VSLENCDGANGNLNDTAFNEGTANTAGASLAVAPRRESA
jgi:hypothetical protein